MTVNTRDLPCIANGHVWLRGCPRGASRTSLVDVNEITLRVPRDRVTCWTPRTGVQHVTHCCVCSLFAFLGDARVMLLCRCVNWVLWRRSSAKTVVRAGGARSLPLVIFGHSWVSSAVAASRLILRLDQGDCQMPTGWRLIAGKISGRGGEPGGRMCGAAWCFRERSLAVFVHP